MQDITTISDILKNKKVFITGAGTIGCAILEKLLQYDIHTVRMFDNSELKLHDIKQMYRENKKVKILLGDIRDKERLRIAIKGVDIIFHTAALKHVSFCEENPVDAVKTNVFGTQNLIDVAIEENVERLVYISTDKSVSPINAMGATKLLGERLITSAANYKGKCKTIFSSVRFGNVMGSSGSIIPIFENQIKNNLPLTITDPNATRFMMKLDDAVNLIISTLELSRGREIFILKMPIVSVLGLAKEMNKIAKRDENLITIIGMEPYEKLHEELITVEEKRHSMENSKMIVIIPPKTNKDYYKSLGFVEFA